VREGDAQPATLRERGEEHRIYTPTRRTDEMGRAYSLNQRLLQEYLVYPFAAHDDASTAPRGGTTWTCACRRC
jgi:hypothetical protein